MQYKKRKSNGQFRSKKNSELLFNFHATIAMIYLFSPLMLVFAFASDTVVYEAVSTSTQDVHIPAIIQTVEAHELSLVEKAIEDIPHESPKTTAIIEYLYEQAPKYDINPDHVAHTIYCESMFYNIQSGIVHEGVREPSFGLAQIHLPSHPSITVEQALNPYFAVDWMITNWHNVAWYGYDRESDSCNNDIAEYWH